MGPMAKLTNPFVLVPVAGAIVAAIVVVVVIFAAGGIGGSEATPTRTPTPRPTYTATPTPTPTRTLTPSARVAPTVATEDQLRGQWQWNVEPEFWNLWEPWREEYDRSGISWGAWFRDWLEQQERLGPAGDQPSSGDFCLPSYWETCPRPTIESWPPRLPIATPRPIATPWRP